MRKDVERLFNRRANSYSEIAEIIRSYTRESGISDAIRGKQTKSSVRVIEINGDLRKERTYDITKIDKNNSNGIERKVVKRSPWAKYSQRKNSEQGSFSYSTRKEDNRDTIINNQQNKIAELQDKNDELQAKNKGLKQIIKGIKSTGRQQIRSIQSESNKMLRTGRETELKMKGKLERAL